MGPSSVARLDRRKRLSPHYFLLAPDCGSDASLLAFLLLFPRLLRLRLRGLICGCLAACTPGADGKAALDEQVHGPVDRNTDGSSLLIDPIVATQSLCFVGADLIELTALVDFQLWAGEILLQIIFVIRRQFARVFRGVGDERTDRRLLRFGPLFEKRIQTVDHKVREESGEDKACQEI